VDIITLYNHIMIPYQQIVLLGMPCATIISLNTCHNEI